MDVVSEIMHEMSVLKMQGRKPDKIYIRPDILADIIKGLPIFTEIKFPKDMPMYSTLCGVRCEEKHDLILPFVFEIGGEKVI